MEIVIYILLGYVVPILIGFGIYFYMFYLSSKTIETVLNWYDDEAVVSLNVMQYLLDKKEEICKIGALLWPLTFIFIMGILFGNDYYNIYIRNNYENRLAAWFF